MMKVLVINPPNKPFSEKSLLIEPIDILTVATYAQSLGNDVKVVDMDVKQMAPESIEAIVKEFRPEITIIPFDYHIPLHRPDAISGVYKIAQIAKENRSKTMVCGKTAKHYPLPFLTNGFDLVINTEIEYVLQQLLRQAGPDDISRLNGVSYMRDGTIITNQTAVAGQNDSMAGKIDINALPIPDRSLIDLKDYIDVRSILSSRGCSMGCSFCSTTPFWGRWRSRQPDSVVDEIEKLVNEHAAKKIIFLDDNATQDKTRIARISEQIIERRINVLLGCLGTVHMGNEEETLRAMHKAGFRWIHYGAESGSDRVLKNVCKGKSREAIRKAVTVSKDAGLRVRTSWIYDLPGTDKQAVEETNKLILETEPDEIRIHYLVARAGTAFQKTKTGISIPSQYIHNDKPNGAINCDTKEVESGVKRLVDELSKKGYLIVNDAREWDAIAKLENPRFVSFCPSRYGLNWER